MSKAKALKSAPLTLTRMNPDLRPGSAAAGTIAICTRDSIKAATATSWIMLDQSFLPPDRYISRYFIQGHILTMQRNACITEMEGDWILFVDDDMTFQPDALRRLLATQRETGADIVGGLCFQRGEPFQPTLYLRKEGAGYTFIETWKPGQVIDVDATGLAFCLITTQALRRIVAHATGDPLEEVAWPDRDFRRAHPANIFRWNGDWGEDFAFMQLAKEAGCRVVVDTGVEIGHIGEITITKETFWREIAFRDREAYEGKKALGDAVGIPTMTRAQALELLGIALDALDA